MHSDTVIRSRSNPLVKRVGAALAGKLPELLVLEGERLVDDALRAGLPLELVLVSEARPALVRTLTDQVPLRVVDDDVLQGLSRLKTSPGVLALAPKPRAQGFDGWRFDARTLILVAAGIADPGNLGALARSAEAFGVQGLVVLGGAGPWGPKALRGSMGSLLRLPVHVAGEADALATELTRRGVRQVRAATRAGIDASGFDWRGPLALWVSGETGDLPPAADVFEPVSIAMGGRVESLNVTVATSLLLYAAGRVRVERSAGLG